MYSLLLDLALNTCLFIAVPAKLPMLVAGAHGVLRVGRVALGSGVLAGLSLPLPPNPIQLRALGFNLDPRRLVQRTSSRLSAPLSLSRCRAAWHAG